MSSCKTVPFLRWAGSKRKSFSILREYWRDDFTCYLEPFAGSASLFFHLLPPKAVLSDINGDLISTLQTVRDNPLGVFNSLRGRPVNSEYYYKLRSRDPLSLTSTERAARFIYLNRFCFNGIYRTNKKGQFNVPFSGTRTGKKPDRQHLLECSEHLKRAHVVQGDFEEIVRSTTKAGNFVYLDPPYATNSRRIFNEYDSQSFGLQDLSRLSGLLDFIDQCGAKFVLSYADCPEANEAFRKWKTKKYSVQRNVSGFAHTRRMATEIICTNIK